MTEETKTPTAEDIMASIAAAGASGDITEVIRLGNLLRKMKSDIEKAEAEKLQKEAEALAGDRQSLAAKILKAVKQVVTDDELAKVKATGFTFKMPYPDASGVMVSASVALTVPQPKTSRKASSGGGGAGVSTKEETGMSLSELIEAYATPEQKAEIQAAYDGAANNKNSARWQEQNKVKKEILKAHPELIQK